MVKIRKASGKDFDCSLKIAKSLDKWFTKSAVKSMKVDFKVNNLIVAVDKGVVGFLCYSSFEESLIVLWMGVKKDYIGKGVGSLLIDHLVKEARKLGLKNILVETLTDKDDYEPYVKTREFYYKNGFKKVCYLNFRKKITPGYDDQILLRKLV